MSDAPVQTQGGLESQPPLPVRRLHNFIYCPRLFYFQWVENIFQENADTVAGSHVHRNVDAPSKLDDPKELGLPEGAKLRSLRLESESLGLIGVVDIVEGGPDGAEIIDYKRGSARRGAEGERVAKEPDAMQVAAHALLLREHGVNAVRGAIYYAADKRRVPVDFSEELFEKVRNSITEARNVAASGKCPPPLKNDVRCLYCSAYPICLPNESLWWAKRPKATPADGQIQFGFIAQSEDAVRNQILEALDFAANSQGSTGDSPVSASDSLDEPGESSWRVAPTDGPVARATPPITLQPPRPDGDDGEVLVVQTAGAQIGQRGDELIVSVKGEDARKIPGQQVRAIYCYGAVQITAQAAETCLELGIDVSYFSPAGRFIGLLRGLPASGVDARRGQYRLFELPGVRLQLAREVIRAKIHNQRVMLMRNGDAPDRVLSLMSGFRDATESARDLTALLGIEGSAAALYFEQFESMLKQRDDWKFDWRGRNRRPPRDPVNALLSLGYSMLAKELTGVCHSVGLDPFLGFMHQPRYGRPALALDLMEEFRPLVADSVAISLINRGELGPEDFIRSANGTFLNDRGRRPFWEAWFRRLDAEVSHPEFSYKMAYRRMLEVQARQLWRFVRGEALTYHGFTTR
jgi:CRISPR-associated protein Cas1